MIMYLDGHDSGTSQRNLKCYSSLNLPIEQTLCIQPLLTGSYIFFASIIIQPEVLYLLILW